jgi:hypothetical protein
MSMEDFIPPGFVPLANWDSRNRRHNDGHSVAWKTLSDAVKNSEIPGFKLSNGRWYVHEQVSSEYLAKSLPQATDGTVTQDHGGIEKRHVESVCESLADISSDVGSTIHRILSVLERLTAAVESIATQPKRDPLEEFANDNGFHDTPSRPAH